MPVDIRAAVSRNISELRKVISDKAAELAALRRELQRHETVLGLLARDGRQRAGRATGRRGRRGGELDAVLNRMSPTFTNKDFFRAASGLGKSALYLRQILSRWAKQGKIKRLERGHYQRVKKAPEKRASA
ncbi:MAG TPA: type IV toxin-antitoxin system AbiEi family antitoxin domain-containing protein [Candidatus Acidoferrales bacterium]|nr:type IV toxin-antitoxin system AbiEi family antitoxin domain-containing protein [Candidatus Acidoferrales bacterium]